MNDSDKYWKIIKKYLPELPPKDKYTEEYWEYTVVKYN